MVKIELTNGDILRMNLKNREREETLRNAWYAMHDVSKWNGKVLKIISYTGNKYSLKVSEIKNCEYSDTVFDYSVPEVEKAIQPPRKIFENSTVPTDHHDKLMGAIEGVHDPDLIKHVIEAAEELFETIPERYKDNMYRFLDELKKRGVPFVLLNHTSLEIASTAMREENPSKIDEHVQRYIDHWRAQKK